MKRKTVLQWIHEPMQQQRILIWPFWVQKWEPLTAIESLSQITAWKGLCRCILPLVSAPSSSQHTVHIVHLQGPCQQLQEGLIEYVSSVFPEELSAPALYQASSRQGAKHKQALRDACHNASDWNSERQHKRKSNLCLHKLSGFQSLFVLFYLTVFHEHDQISNNRNKSNLSQCLLKRQESFLIKDYINSSWLLPWARKDKSCYDLYTLCCIILW